MKANRKFVTEEEAVSPVIAVILMVAITVVLAATVFVLVSDIGGQSGQSAPAVGLRTDDGADRVVVDSAASGADWNRLAIRLQSQGGAEAILVGDAATAADEVFVNEAAGDTTPASNTVSSTNLELTNVNDPIAAGDFIELCADVVAPAVAADVVVTIIDTQANQVLQDFTFLQIAAC